MNCHRYDTDRFHLKSLSYIFIIYHVFSLIFMNSHFSIFSKNIDYITIYGNK